jgi:hypothetical protein
VRHIAEAVIYNNDILDHTASLTTIVLNLAPMEVQIFIS